MTDLSVAPARTAAPSPPPAAALAASIAVPARLPDRYDGEPLRHLSPSSYALWVACPEAWRRRYIAGEKPPTTGSMFLGSRVDDALSAYFRRLLEHGDRMSLDQVLDIYRDHWAEALDPEGDKRGIEWEEELTERAAFEMGRDAIALALAELVPQLGDPVDVQRRLEFSLAPELEWSVLCYLDLETLKDHEVGTPAPTVVDFKVKGSLITTEQAQRDPQAGLYLAGRWLEGYPANELVFAQIAKPGKRRKHMSAALISTSRSVGEMRGVLARIALAASQIAAAYERYGPERPWGFADPSGWKCSPRYCHHWASCPGGRGL